MGINEFDSICAETKRHEAQEAAIERYESERAGRVEYQALRLTGPHGIFDAQGKAMFFEALNQATDSLDWLRALEALQERDDAELGRCVREAVHAYAMDVAHHHAEGIIK